MKELISKCLKYCHFKEKNAAWFNNIRNTATATDVAGQASYILHGTNQEPYKNFCLKECM